MVGDGRSRGARRSRRCTASQRAGAAEDGSLHWDIGGLHREVLAGPAGGWAGRRGRHRRVGGRLRAARRPRVGCSGIPFCYRDSRTDGVADRVARAGRRRGALRHDRPAAAAVQHDLPARGGALTRRRRRHAARPGPARPSGSPARSGRRPRTPPPPSCTTSGPGPGRPGLAGEVDVPAGILPAAAGARRRHRAAAAGGRRRDGLAGTTPVVAVGSHDTASAVVGVPFADPRRAAYISSGTWSLVGRRARRAGVHRGGPAGELHQRGRAWTPRSASCAT